MLQQVLSIVHTPGNNKCKRFGGGAVHPWIGINEKVPLDILVYRLVRNYLRSSSMKRAALKVSNLSPHYELWVLHTVHHNMYQVSHWRRYYYYRRLHTHGPTTLQVDQGPEFILQNPGCSKWQNPISILYRILTRKLLEVSFFWHYHRHYRKHWWMKIWCTYVLSSFSWSQTRMDVSHLKILEWCIFRLAIFLLFFFLFKSCCSSNFKGFSQSPSCINWVHLDLRPVG